MADKRVEAILRKTEQLVSESQPFVDTWQQITDYMLPGRRVFLGQSLFGDRGTAKLYDGTAISASHLLSASIHGSISSPDTHWLRYQAQDDYINNRQECRLWLDDTTRRVHWHFGQSNLYAEIGESYLEDVLFGTGNLYMTEKDQAQPQFSGFRFQAVGLGQYVIAENADGIVDTVIRPYIEMTAESLLRKWPDTASEMVRQQARDNPYTKVKVIHAVYPREGGRPNTFAKTMPFASCYLESETGTLLEESGHNENPYLVSRWAKVPNEVWGRGPGWFALPDVKSLNLAKELELTGWAMAIRPPIKRLESGVIGRVRLSPGGETLVRNMEDIQPITAVKTDWTATQVKGQEIARGIRELFFRDQLELVESDRMTATEVEQRVQLMQRFLGPTLGRMNSEKLQPLGENAFLMLYRRQALLPLPPALDVYLRRGGALQIKYEGPLARTQRLSELQAVNRALAAFAGMAQVDPKLATEALDYLDPSGVADIVLDATGVNARARRDERQVAAIRQARAQAQQMMNQMEQAEAIAEGMGKAAPMVKALQPAPGAQP